MKKVSERIFYVFKIIFIFLGNLIALFWPNSKSTSSQSNPPKTSSKKESPKKVKSPKDEETSSPVNPSSRDHYKDYTKEKTLEEQLEELFDECVYKLKLRKKDSDPIKEKVIKEIKEQIEKKEIKKDKVPKKMEEKITEELAPKEKNLQSVLTNQEAKKNSYSKKEVQSPKEKAQPQKEVKSSDEKFEKNVFIPLPEEKQDTNFISKTIQQEPTKIVKAPEESNEEELLTPIKEIAISSSISMIQPLISQNLEFTQEILPPKEPLQTKTLETTLEEKPLPPIEKEIEVLIEKEELKKEVKQEKNKEVPKEKKPPQEEEKKQEIDEDKEALESPILQEEKEKFQELLEQKHLEEQLELNEQILNKTPSEVKVMEKKLMKDRLKKASRVLEFPFLAGLPFIRNKFFLSFGLGVIVSKHLDFIQSLLTHQSKEYQPMNLEEIKTGKEALEYAIFKTEENINQLFYLEQEMFQKYPELVEDEEFIKQINRLKLNLYKSEKKLRKKEEKLGILYLKVQKRILKRKNWKGQI